LIFEGAIDIGDEVVIHKPVEIGLLTYINVGAVVFPHVSLGRFCSIGRSVQIGLASHPTNFLSTHPFQFSPGLFAGVEGYAQLQTAKWRFHEPTSVGHDVWIGAAALIMSGVTIGTGAVIGAGAVVTRDVAPYDVVGGVPARKIGQRFEREIVERLLGSKWWELPFDKLAEIEFSNIEAALGKIEEIHSERKNS